MKEILFRVIGSWLGGFAGFFVYVWVFTNETEILGPVTLMLWFGVMWGAIPGVFVGGVIGVVKEFISQARGGQTEVLSRPNVPKILRLGIVGCLVGGFAGIGFVVLLMMGDEARPTATFGAIIGYLIGEYGAKWLNRRAGTNPLR